MNRTYFMSSTAVSAIALAIGTAFIAAPHTALAQAAAGVSDPGVRGGAAGAGGPLPGLSSSTALPEVQFFNAAKFRFTEIDSVLPPGTPGFIDDAAGTSSDSGGGLGPRFNDNSCTGCHSFPAEGGAAPAKNPQISLATLDGAKNTVPPFITANGPTREARFIKTPNGTPDGGVHDLFTIAGRSDASGCNAVQPNFPQAIAQNNIIFRIPISTFGDGLVENTPDGNLETDAQNQSGPEASLGITSGVFNHSGNDGTITRFGWKAQNKSLLIFAGEAYNVEQGVTNELFPNEREDQAGCRINALPEDATVITANGPTSPSGLAFSDDSADVINFAAFMRLLAAPTPAASNNTTVQGSNQFFNVGCAECHIVGHETGSSIFTNQSFVSFQPFSDFALHDMGTGLQDQVSQGGANGLQFRSAPLWGVGQRVFFLHDGRTSNIVTAIEDHSSSGSEANQVISNFNKLSASDQQAVVDFLRSL
jgi:CxxC motif-containing protein (DUF1111 family)